MLALGLFASVNGYAVGYFTGRNAKDLDLKERELELKARKIKSKELRKIAEAYGTVQDICTENKRAPTCTLL